MVAGRYIVLAVVVLRQYHMAQQIVHPVTAVLGVQMHPVPAGLIQQVALAVYKRRGDIHIPYLLFGANLHQLLVELPHVRQRKPIGRTALLLQLSYRQYRLRVNISVRVALLD